jgi:hypothetical protein
MLHHCPCGRIVSFIGLFGGADVLPVHFLRRAWGEWAEQPPVTPTFAEEPTQEVAGA